MDDEATHEILQLRMQVAMLMGLVLNHEVIIGAQAFPRDSKKLRQGAEKSLAFLGKLAERIELQYLSNSSLHEAKRALYADEFHEMIESLKASVNSMADNYAKIFEAPRA